MSPRLDPADRPRRSLRGAWWIAAAVAAFFALSAIWQVREVRHSASSRALGDGKNVATYGFDLAGLAVPRHLLVAGGMPRDGLAPLQTPPLLTAAQVDSLNHAERGKYLVADDLVVGVAAGPLARAYPLRVLNWHEVADDTLGGVPIAVAYHPLSGTTVVLDRRHRGEVLDLALSGLLYDSHHLLFDRRPEPDRSSLWVPLLGEAVAGPARGDTLRRVDHVLTTWAAWRAAHPATTVPWPDPAQRQAYKRDPYGNYASGDVLRYPVASLPPVPAGHRLKSRVAVRRGPDGALAGEFVTPEADGPDVRREPALAYAYWFAWEALLAGGR